MTYCIRNDILYIIFDILYIIYDTLYVICDILHMIYHICSRKYTKSIPEISQKYTKQQPRRATGPSTALLTPQKPSK